MPYFQITTLFIPPAKPSCVFMFDHMRLFQFCKLQFQPPSSKPTSSGSLNEAVISLCTDMFGQVKMLN